MRNGTRLFAFSLGLLLMIVAAIPYAAATYGRAHIWIPDKGESLWDEKLTCEQEVKGPYVAALKKENPEIDEKELAKRIVIAADDEKGTIVITVPADNAKAAIENAARIARIAVNSLVERAQSGQRFALEAISEDRHEATAAMRALQRNLADLQRENGMYDPKKEMESLVSRLNSYREDLVQAEMKKAELEAKLELLSEKAAQVKDTVSAEEIASLEKAERELRMQLGEQSTKKAIEKYELILRQKEQQFKRVSQLHKTAVVSTAEVEKAQFELEMAKHDYEQAHESVKELSLRLEGVRQDLAKAKATLAETGGLALATIIGQKALECETEMAAVKVKTRHLHIKTQELEAEIAQRGVVATELERRQAEIDGLRKRLAGLYDSETAVRAQIRGRMPPQIVMVETLERLPEPAATYSIVGEVRNPASQELPAGRTTVLTAIALAGGFTDYANDKGVVVLRYTEVRTERHNIDVSAILKGKADDFIVQSGDIIWVPRMGPFQ